MSYRIAFREYLPSGMHFGPIMWCANGPYDFAINARTERNKFFAENEWVKRCWIERIAPGHTDDHSVYGKVLQRG